MGDASLQEDTTGAVAAAHGRLSSFAGFQVRAGANAGSRNTSAVREKEKRWNLITYISIMNTRALPVRAFAPSGALTCGPACDVHAPVPGGLCGPCHAQVVEVLNEDPLTKSLAVLGRYSGPAQARNLQEGSIDLGPEAGASGRVATWVFWSAGNTPTDHGWPALMQDTHVTNLVFVIVRGLHGSLHLLQLHPPSTPIHVWCAARRFPGSTDQAVLLLNRKPFDKAFLSEDQEQEAVQAASGEGPGAGGARVGLLGSRLLLTADFANDIYSKVVASTQQVCIGSLACLRQLRAWQRQ